MMLFNLRVFCSQGQGKREVAECKVKYHDLRKEAFQKRTTNATATGNEPPEVLTKNEEAVLADHDAEGSHLADGIPGGVESLVSCLSTPPFFADTHIPFLSVIYVCGLFADVYKSCCAST